jgi:hypothetical protein
MKIHKTIILILAVLAISRIDAQYFESYFPIEAKTNANIEIVGTDIVYTSENNSTTGYVKINNYRNTNWSEDKNIGFNRYDTYWIAGEFIPSFGNNGYIQTSRNTPFNLLHLYYSIYIRYSPPKSDSEINHYSMFQFGFYPNWNSPWIVANTPNIHSTDNLKFSPNDLMRYIVRHKIDGGDKGITIWVINTENNNIVTGRNSTIDDSTYYGGLPIREFYIGSGTHGNMYDGIDSPRDSFWGTIHETIIAQGDLDENQATNWLINGIIPDSGIILFRQSKELLNRVPLIPLYHWSAPSSMTGSLKLATQTQMWDGAHNVLQSVPYTDSYDHRIEYNAEQELSDSDLTNSILSFTSNIQDELNKFFFYIKVEDDNNNEPYITFSPAYTDTSYVDGYIRVPLYCNLNEWKHHNYDLLELFRYVYPITENIKIRGFAMRGKAYIGDILLLPHISNPPSIVSLPTGFTVGDNYTNPFNPKTTIRYNIPEVSQYILLFTIYWAVWSVVLLMISRRQATTTSSGTRGTIWAVKYSTGSISIVLPHSRYRVEAPLRGSIM